MALTKAEETTIRNLVARLKEPRAGCAEPFSFTDGPAPETLAPGYEGVSRIYLETWVIGPLELLLPGDGRDPELAARMSGR